MTETPAATRCYICGHANQQSLEEHHIVPRRLNGSDTPENTVYLCGSCHNAVESLYDDDFYRRLGIAVEGVDDDAFADRSLGAEVSPEHSIDRKIPVDSTHVNFESWTLKVSIADVREPAEMKTNLQPELHEEVVKTLQEEQKTILTQYKSELENAKPPTDYHDDPVWWNGGTPAVDFLFRHGDVTKPVFRVTNPYENGVDYEAHKRSDDELISPQLKHPTTRIPIDQDGDGKAWEDVVVYRMHCGYCRAAFSEFEHSDLARHLRMRHGIEDPWTAPDQTFSGEADNIPLRERRS